MPKKEIYQKNKEKYKQATTDNGGATTKLSREGASLKHTAKVRPKEECNQDEQDEIQEDTTSMEEKLVDLNKN